MVSIVAAMGFDWRHVVRSILRIGFKECTSIHLLLPPWSDERAEAGIKEVEKIALAAGLSKEKIHTHRLDVRNYQETIMQLAKMYVDLMSEGGVLLSLGGGMRILVVEALAAALMLGEKDWRKHVRIVVDLEGREESVEFSAEDLASLSLKPPNARELEAIKIALDSGTVTPKKLSEILEIPRSTAHAILGEALRKGYLEKIGWGKYRATSLGKAILYLHKIQRNNKLP